MVQSKLPVSAVQQQGNSNLRRNKAATPVRHLADPPTSSLGPLTQGDASQSDTKAAAAVQNDANDQAGSTACVAAESGIGQAAVMASADGGSGSYAGYDYGGAHVIRLLAHTEEGVSVQQAVMDHFLQCVRSITAALPDESPDHRGIPEKPGQLQVPGSETSATAAADVGGQLQGGSADRKPVAVLAIGPEGGWTSSEIALLTQEHAFQMVTMAGGRTLDTTTAIISLVSLVGEAMVGCSDQPTC